ncbi:GTP cyclohydrolase IIa [Paenibacillus kandeliae]|uniref:GTP cyclohydrolase IIa n=1 Tax=Paenibacillus kandeliae TaxID=3231269 RepID=UPI00345B218E
MMTYRFGVIGPQPSVEHILEITASMGEDVQFIPYIYNHPQEIPDILERNRIGLKGWFFSGPIPLSVAQPYLQKHELAVYCKPAGSALYKAMVQMMNAQDVRSQPYSIDMIRSEDLDLHESFAELGIPMDGLPVRIFDGTEEPNHIVQFHLELWKSGKSVAALTCMHFIYSELQKHGMPVYRLMITRQDIRQAAQLLIQQARSSYFKDTQIGMQIVEADLLGASTRGNGSRYSVQYAELKMQQRILQLCERLDGIMVHNGVGSYQMISTRGAIERELGRLRQTVEQMELEADMPMSVGIGYGDTAFTASNHAMRALQHARHNRQQLLVIVQDNGDIREIDKDEGEWSYASRSLDSELLEKLNEANISVKTYRKIEALTRHMNWDGFTTTQLAQHLSMTIRNAQRIMSSLCYIGLAEIDGEEQQSVRGRPRKIYRLRREQ